MTKLNDTTTAKQKTKLPVDREHKLKKCIPLIIANKILCFLEGESLIYYFDCPITSQITEEQKRQLHIVKTLII